MKRLAITALILCFLFISCEAGKTQSGISGDLENRLEEPEDENRAPDFRLIDTKGELVDLASFKDKKSLILLFWTTWCPYCRRAMRDLNQEYAQLESLDIEVLAINIMERASRIKLFLSSFPGFRGNVTSYFFVISKEGWVSPCIKSPSFVINRSPSEDSSNLPAGTSPLFFIGIRSITVFLPSSSATEVIIPRGLFNIIYVHFFGIVRRFPLNFTTSFSGLTLKEGSDTTLPFTFMTPSSSRVFASLLDTNPALAKKR